MGNNVSEISKMSLAHENCHDFPLSLEIARTTNDDPSFFTEPIDEIRQQRTVSIPKPLIDYRNNEIDAFAIKS